MGDIKGFSKEAEELLESMKKESIYYIQVSEEIASKKAWYYSHLGSLDFARMIGLISEDRRRELEMEFKEIADDEIFNTEVKKEDQ